MPYLVIIVMECVDTYRKSRGLNLKNSTKIWLNKSGVDLSAKYLIVTAARNEEDALQDLAKDIINQSVIPALWVIGDDSSNDRTWSIIEQSSI